jgi:aminomethyltransferase
MATRSDTVSIDAAYHAVHENAIYVDRSNLGMLKFTGETRQDLIHRMSTQNVLDLQSGSGTATILTSDIGRMIDRLLLYASSDAVYAITGENNNDNVARYLMRFIFFQDDFQVTDLSADTTIVAVYGSGAAARLAGIAPDAATLPLHHWREKTIGDATVYLHRTDPIAGAGYLLTCEASARDLLFEHLAEAGLTAADDEAFDYLRIEAGLPRFGHEITSDYIPLEAGLWDDVSFSKGCYVGQEIIARMESRGRLAKKLVLLRAARPIPSGAEIEADGRSAGIITSAATGPAGILALGYVKTKALEEAGAALSVGDISLEVSEEAGGKHR